jgi:hypothetical protein
VFCLPSFELKIEANPSKSPRIAKVRIKMIMLDHIVLRYYISIHKDLVLNNNQSVLLSEIAKSVCTVAERLDPSWPV